MLINHIRVRGVTIIEMMIAITIISMLLMLALPSMSTWLNNAQIRTAGETMLNGITLARSEALHRNTTVRFQLTTTLDSSCARSATGTSWVVSLADPAGACDAAPSDTTAPQIIQKKSGSEGSPRAQIAANGGTNTIYFNGLGRPVNPGRRGNHHPDRYYEPHRRSLPERGSRQRSHALPAHHDFHRGRIQDVRSGCH